MLPCFYPALAEWFMTVFTFCLTKVREVYGSTSQKARVLLHKRLISCSWNIRSLPVGDIKAALSPAQLENQLLLSIRSTQAADRDTTHIPSSYIFPLERCCLHITPSLLVFIFSSFFILHSFFFFLSEQHSPFHGYLISFSLLCPSEAATSIPHLPTPISPSCHVFFFSLIWNRHFYSSDSLQRTTWYISFKYLQMDCDISLITVNNRCVKVSL